MVRRRHDASMEETPWWSWWQWFMMTMEWVQGSPCYAKDKSQKVGHWHVMANRYIEQPQLMKGGGERLVGLRKD